MPVRVMTLNVLMGGEERLEALLALVARERPAWPSASSTRTWWRQARPRITTRSSRHSGTR